jgi:hypothetical protein
MVKIASSIAAHHSELFCIEVLDLAVRTKEREQRLKKAFVDRDGVGKNGRR